MKLTLRSLLCFLILISIGNSAYADLDQRGMVWAGVTVDGPLSKDYKWNYNVMNQARLSNQKTVLEQYVFRPSIYYQATSNWSFWLGYDGIPTVPFNSLSYVYFQRVWPQVLYTTQIHSNIDLSARSRLEFMWLTGNPDMGLILRQSAGFAVRHWNKYNIDFDFFDDIFLLFNRPSWAPRHLVQQNRIYAGLIFKLSCFANLNVGYMNLYRPLQNDNLMDHIFVVGLGFKFSKEFLEPIQTVE